MQDNNGNTALHLAVELSQLEAIDCLVDGGADTAILNDKKMAPIHVAADGGFTKSLEVRSYLDGVLISLLSNVYGMYIHMQSCHTCY